MEIFTISLQQGIIEVLIYGILRAFCLSKQRHQFCFQHTVHLHSGCEREAFWKRSLHSLLIMIYWENRGRMHSKCEERDCADVLLYHAMIWSHCITPDAAKWRGEKRFPWAILPLPSPLNGLNAVQFGVFFWFLSLHENKSLEKSISNTITIQKDYSDKKLKESSQEVNKYCISAKCLGDKFWTWF